MAEDVFVVKPPKASSFLSRMITLVFAMACGVYICSICLKQLSDRTKTLVEIIDAPCDSYRIRLTEAPYIHYPHPQTFLRQSRAECKNNPVRYFVIISVQRSGSGWFETLLNSHVNMSSNGEIFSVKERRSNISSIVRTLDRVYNLDWMGSASKNECSAAVGFKWMLNQVLLTAFVVIWGLRLALFLLTSVLLPSSSDLLKGEPDLLKKPSSYPKI
ncbi:hypothetical protein AKJ16_DCAP05876 [Drosera capensis]